MSSPKEVPLQFMTFTTDLYGTHINKTRVNEGTSDIAMLKFHNSVSKPDKVYTETVYLFNHMSL